MSTKNLEPDAAGATSQYIPSKADCFPGHSMDRPIATPMVEEEITHDGQTEKPDHDAESISTTKQGATALYLADLVRTLMAECQTRGFRASPLVLRHFDKNYTMIVRSVAENPLPFAGNREELFDNLERAIKDDESFAWTVDNISVNVHRGSRTAEVYSVIHEKYTLNGQTLWREGFGVHHFVKQPEDGVWVTYRYQSLRGGGPQIP